MGKKNKTFETANTEITINRKKIPDWVKKVFAHIILSLGGLSMLLPFVWMLSTSLKSPGATFVFPPEWIPQRAVLVMVTNQNEYGRDEVLTYNVYRATNSSGQQIKVVRTGFSNKMAVCYEYDETTGGIKENAPRLVFAYKDIFDSIYKVPSFQFHNYVEAVQKIQFFRKLLNTLKIAILITVFQLIFSSMAAYSFSRIQWKGRDQVFLLYLGTMMIPAVVSMIPLFRIVNMFKWYGTHWAIIIPGLFTPWSTFFMRQFLLGLPYSLDEAAMIDGAGRWRIFWTILMPLCKPALATLSVFTFMFHWNDFMWPLINLSHVPQRQTLAIGIYSFVSSYSSEWNLLMAAAGLAIIPIILLYLFNQRFFTEGIALSGVKG